MIPLEFIFGDLLARFTPEEDRIVATLSYPTEPIPVTAIAEISGVDESTTRRALKLLTNRSIVIPQEGEEKYTLVPMIPSQTSCLDLIHIPPIYLA
jgi:hypothetical protein